MSELNVISEGKQNVILNYQTEAVSQVDSVFRKDLIKLINRIKLIYISLHLLLFPRVTKMKFWGEFIIDCLDKQKIWMRPFSIR